MKHLLRIAFFSLLIPLQACAVEQWQEGEHYKVISDEATPSPEIREYFSFWCPHCFNFEPLVAQIKAKMGDNVTFTKVHVNFMRFTSKAIQDDATRAMMVARALEKEDEMNSAIFNYIHVQRSPVTSLDDLKNLFLLRDVSSDEFDKLANSFGVNSMMKKNQKAIDEHMRFLAGVPNFIVNGKYQATFTRDMTNDDIVDLVVWLSKQP
ncbi:thiol:disulfide interchange protein DsbA/DsbL [Aestuariibacter halophilus]|uniref:Thiol:disulfide interchange protein n=1 Tax=Fluctibacter halophilus TaxID=226011 RepID=A0ABS8G8H4_9ALTE|nr:thiol:disulfide interchange protein DsbA/DsbL [Aestuariibacter halophilus]MCC2616401.1 thiol:disulfide interchange protein DsbA/DsbL [Aestuariibacter halophilus]